jgi:hypothetical protein
MYWSMKYIAAGFILVALSLSHYYVYNKGQSFVQAKWDADKIVVAMQYAADAEKALSKLTALQAAKQKVDVQYAQDKRKAVVAATSAQLELDRLRDTLASNNEATGADNASTIARANGASRLEQELLGNCATALVAMAAEADRLEATIVGLQSYINNVYLTK